MKILFTKITNFQINLAHSILYWFAALSCYGAWKKFKILILYNDHGTCKLNKFFTKNPYLIASIIILNSFILYLWYCYGFCILSPIENALDHSERAAKTSYMSDFFINYLSINNINEFMSYLPLVYIIYGSIKLVYLTKKCKI